MNIAIADVKSFHREAELLRTMAHLGRLRRETHLTETVTLLVDHPPMLLISQEGHQGEPLTQMTEVAIHQLDSKDPHQVTVKAALVIMILCLDQNVHMLHWLVLFVNTTCTFTASVIVLISDIFFKG